MALGGQMDEWWVDGWMNGGWMDGWMGGWMDGWQNWVKVCLQQSTNRAALIKCFDGPHCLVF